MDAAARVAELEAQLAAIANQQRGIIDDATSLIQQTLVSGTSSLAQPTFGQACAEVDGVLQGGEVNYIEADAALIQQQVETLSLLASTRSFGEQPLMLWHIASFANAE